ncbi:zinc-ribbon domain-containing protein [Candidatus Parcubacteria bacterium]|nr:zinc-ribbon domain-containing protein [Candidatus Parcubacteria bacterium]
MEKEKTEKLKHSANIFSWRINETELNYQVDNYSKLKITESYRGISVLITTALLGISILLALFNLYPLEEILYGLIIYVPILLFVYKGHRWAIVALMILWTFEKGYQFIEVGGIMPLIWWVIITPYFYRVLKVENKRRKLPMNQSTISDQCFCSHCGEVINTDAKFCAKCGTKI